MSFFTYHKLFSLLFTLYHASCVWQLLLKNFMMRMMTEMKLISEITVKENIIKNFNLATYKIVSTAP